MSAAQDEEELQGLRDRFSAEERALEHKIDHEVHTFSATLDMQYNVRRAVASRCPCHSRASPRSAVPVQVSALLPRRPQSRVGDKPRVECASSCKKKLVH